MTGETDLPFLDLSAPGFSTRSNEVMAARTSHWCARTPYGLAVLRHREAGLLLRDRRLRQGSHAWPRRHGMSGSFTDFWERSVIGQQGDDHKALRSLAMPALAPDWIASLTPRFDTIASELADAVVARGRCEFISEFSEPFAGQAICVLLDLPTSDWPGIAHDAADLGYSMGVDCLRHKKRINAACDRLMDLARHLIARARSGEDRQSYVARLVARYDEMGTLNPQALLDLVVISIFGGVDTTRAQLGFAIALFTEHPDQWTWLRANRSGIPAAIEEVIRERPTTTWATREAVEDFTFEGVTIHSGQTVHILAHATARDPAICTDPDFDIRAARKVHFGFGGGAHHCLGQLVARTDMACAINALADRVDRFQFAGTPQWLPDTGNTCPRSLPIRFDAVQCRHVSNAIPS